VAGGAAHAPGGAAGLTAERARAREVLEPLLEALEGVFSSVDETRAELLARHRSARLARRRLRRGELAEMRPLLHAHLARHASLIAGTGVICAPGLLADAERWLEWWCSAGSGPPRQLRVSLDPRDPEFYDYEEAEWYAAPLVTRARSVAGPFVDHSGTDQHIVTLTLPVHDEESWIGVAGADVCVGQLEPLVLRSLRRLDREAVLVNAEGRVIATNTARHLAGDLLPRRERRWLDEVPGEWAARPDGALLARDPRTPWALLELPRVRSPRASAPESRRSR
jgi:hypothetical protein